MPFTNGWTSALGTGFTVLPRLFILGILDVLFGTDKHPVRVSLVGKPGETALMNADDVMDGFYPLLPLSMHHHYFTNQKVPARLVPLFPLNNPGSYAKHIKCPVYFGICGKDTVAPAKKTLAYAKQAPKGEYTVFDDMGHFDIYLGEKHDRAWEKYSAFIQKALPV